MEKSENEWREAVSLFCQLLKATFSTPAKDSRAARGQYIIALGHVASFCALVGGDTLISSRFFRLAAALFDVQYGLKPELLTGGIRSTGRLADPSDVWHLRCHAALILELLVQTGISEGDAAEKIINSCPNIKNVTRTSRDPKTSLIYWRKILTEETEQAEEAVQNEFARETFQDALKFLSSLDGLSKPDMAAHLMKSFDQQAGRQR